MNLLSNDASKLESSVIFVPYLLIGPLQTLAVVVLLVKLVDYTALIGLIVICLNNPIQSILAKITNFFR